jgi:hypothetical protein
MPKGRFRSSSGIPLLELKCNNLSFRKHFDFQLDKHNFFDEDAVEVKIGGEAGPNAETSSSCPASS